MKYTNTHELKATDNILKWTNQYQENTDIYLQFLNENTGGNKEGHIHCSTLYDTFKILVLKISNYYKSCPKFYFSGNQYNLL
jgi:hypothetical protein